MTQLTRMTTWLALSVGICLGTGFATSGEVQAGSKNAARGGYKTVTAVSRYSGGTITAPVRTGRWGDEVRLPGGTWIDCKLDCRETLRQETVDFWDEQADRQPSADPN